MVLNPRPLDLAETLPHTIWRTSDRIPFGGMRVLLRELPAAGWVDAPGGLNHFWLGYRPLEEPGRLVAEFADAHFTHFAERSLLFCAAGSRHGSEWRGGEGRVAHFQFQPAFLEGAATSLGMDPRGLRQSPLREVGLDQPLEALCRLLMREVEQGCPHGSGYFEALSRALALALLQRLATARPVLGREERVMKAIRFLEQHFQEPVSFKAVAEAIGLTPCQLVRAFRAAVGVSPQAYLVQCRLRHARRLLASGAGRWSLGQVAIEAGFCDQAHLTRHFRRAFGQTPGRWREQ